MFGAQPTASLFGAAGSLMGAAQPLFGALPVGGMFNAAAGADSVLATNLLSVVDSLPESEKTARLGMMVIALSNFVSAVAASPSLGERVQKTVQSTVLVAEQALQGGQRVAAAAWETALAQHAAVQPCERCGAAQGPTSSEEPHFPRCPKVFHTKEKAGNNHVLLCTGYDPKCGNCGVKASEARKSKAQRGGAFAPQQQQFQPQYQQPFPPLYQQQQQPYYGAQMQQPMVGQQQGYLPQPAPATPAAPQK